MLIAIILPIVHVSLTLLDGVKSFVCIINVRNTVHVNICVTVKNICGILQCKEESWKNLNDTTAFSLFLVCRSVVRKYITSATHS